MQKHVNLVDLIKSFPTNIYLQNLASMQKRTSPLNFAHLAEKSEKGSISNLSTKPPAAERRGGTSSPFRGNRAGRGSAVPSPDSKAGTWRRAAGGPRRFGSPGRRNRGRA